MYKELEPSLVVQVCVLYILYTTVLNWVYLQYFLKTWGDTDRKSGRGRHRPTLK